MEKYFLFYLAALALLLSNCQQKSAPQNAGTTKTNNQLTQKEFLDADFKVTDSLQASYYKITQFHKTTRDKAVVEIYHVSGLLRNRYEVKYTSPIVWVYDGPQVHYYDNGKLKTEMSYRNDKINGILKSYHPDGKLRRNDTYKEGKLVKGNCYDIAGRDTTYFEFERYAYYIAGEEALYSFIQENLKYPEEARMKSIEGRVQVKFNIEKDGSVSNIHIHSGVTDLLDQEAVRVVSMLKGFAPAIQGGDRKRFSFIVPVRFRLTDSDPPTK